MNKVAKYSISLATMKYYGIILFVSATLMRGIMNVKPNSLITFVIGATIAKGRSRITYLCREMPYYPPPLRIKKIKM